MKILIINGPNLNLLGLREPHIYGNVTLKQIEEKILQYCQKNKIEIAFKQSNFEGEIINAIHEARENYDGIIINAGAFTHYSYAIRDAIAAIKIPVIEVHLSNIYAREDFRHKSVLSPVVKGLICGFGEKGYLLALDALKYQLLGE